MEICQKFENETICTIGSFFGSLLLVKKKKYFAPNKGAYLLTRKIWRKSPLAVRQVAKLIIQKFTDKV